MPNGHDDNHYQRNRLYDRDHNYVYAETEQNGYDDDDGHDNDAPVEQKTMSGGLSQENKATSTDHGDDIRQKNKMYDEDYNKHKSYIDQYGHHNHAGVKQTAYSGGNSQKNDGTTHGDGDEYEQENSVNWLGHHHDGLYQKNKLEDDDRNKNKSDIEQKGKSNTADVEQKNSSGMNEQSNKGTIDDHGYARQRNKLDDEDHNRNKSYIEQYGEANDADVTQNIYSGHNKQKNEVEVDDGGIAAQKNKLKDDDNNKNYSNIYQGGKDNNGPYQQSNGEYNGNGHHPGDNHATVVQKIYSGGNQQANDGDVDGHAILGQLNYLDDEDRNRNKSEIDQRGKGNEADVTQNIYSGGNEQKKQDQQNQEQKNNAVVDGAIVGQLNWLEEYDNNKNYSDIDQKGKHNDADVEQTIGSGRNYQSNQADADGGDHGGESFLGGLTLLGQANYLDDEDYNRNKSDIEQRGKGNDADVEQHIYSGYNSQTNEADVEGGSGFGLSGQLNWLEEDDNNKNYADIDQTGGGKHKGDKYETPNGENGHHGHHHGGNNYANAVQGIYSGDNTQSNDADVDGDHDYDYNGESLLSGHGLNQLSGLGGFNLQLLGQANYLDDDDYNRNEADIDQHGKGNSADVQQKIFSGLNEQKNEAHADSALVGQLNWLNDQEKNEDEGNENYASIDQRGKGNVANLAPNEHNPYLGQYIESGSNYQSNYAEVASLALQINYLDDDDENLNKTEIEQRGKDNTVDLKQSIKSGKNEQKNKADVEGDGHLFQKNKLEDDDENENYANIYQGGGKHKGGDSKSLNGENGDHGHHHHGGEHSAEVKQYISSGGNYQSNKATITDEHNEGELRQWNYLDDEDENLNKTDIDQHGKDNHAEVNQTIYSGYNTQKNKATIDDDAYIDDHQKNVLDDHDDNENSVEIHQGGGKHKGDKSDSLSGKYGGDGHHHYGDDNTAKVTQIIGSGGNYQSNKATLSDDAEIEEQANEDQGLDDHDENDNKAKIYQRGEDNDAGVTQKIFSGYNSQTNKATVSGSGDVDQDNNDLRDHDHNENKAKIGQRGEDNDATVYQEIVSGDNTQKNKATVSGSGEADQDNDDLDDEDHNDNKAKIYQRGEDNDADVEQYITSGFNKQKNEATVSGSGEFDEDQDNDLDDDDDNDNRVEIHQGGGKHKGDKGDKSESLNGKSGGHGHHHYAEDNEADVLQVIKSGHNSQTNTATVSGSGEIEEQDNDLDDDDENENEAKIYQRGSGNDADVEQQIYSGNNSQLNTATVSGSGYLDQDNDDFDDNDENYNEAKIHQSGGHHHHGEGSDDNGYGNNKAHASQYIESGFNSQSNTATVSGSGEADQDNDDFDDGDENDNELKIYQRGSGNEAGSKSDKIEQNIYSGNNSQKNEATVSGSGDIDDQDNDLDDIDINNNYAKIHQGGGKHKDDKSESLNGKDGHHGHHGYAEDNTAMLKQTIGSGGNSQSNNATVSDSGFVEDQDNNLDDGDENDNHAEIYQRGKGNDADVEQTIYSGYNSQSNEATVGGDGDVDQENEDSSTGSDDVDDIDINYNHAEIRQAGGHHHGHDDESDVYAYGENGHHHGGNNHADVTQYIASGDNTQSNHTDVDDDGIVDEQDNELDDGDENENHLKIYQRGSGNEAGSVYDEDDDEILQKIKSGYNTQTNEAKVRGDGEIDDQDNRMDDIDINKNEAEVHQYGKNNDAEATQKIYSGFNEQKNDADIHDGDVDQDNDLDDGDENTNHANINQGEHGDSPYEVSKSHHGDNGDHSSDNYAEVDQEIQSGFNEQTNTATTEHTDADQSNHLHDYDTNTNHADVDQYGEHNHADVDQRIYSGGNTQSNKITVDDDYNGYEDYNNHHNDDYDVHQVNVMYDQDNNKNEAHVNSQNGYEHSAVVEQEIASGGNYQSNESLIEVA